MISRVYNRIIEKLNKISVAITKWEFSDRLINKYEYQDELSKISDEGWQIVQIDRNTQQYAKILLQRPIMDSDLSVISQESDSEHLLEAFTKWLCEDDYFELQDWPKLRKQFLASNCD